MLVTKNRKIKYQKSKRVFFCMYKRADKKLNPVSRWVASTTETSECSNLTGEVVKLEMLNRPQQQRQQLLVLVLARRRLGRCVASCWSGACCITLPPAVAYLAALLLWLNWYLTLAGRWVVGWLAVWRSAISCVIFLRRWLAAAAARCLVIGAPMCRSGGVARYWLQQQQQQRRYSHSFSTVTNHNNKSFVFLLLLLLLDYWIYLVAADALFCCKLIMLWRRIYFTSFQISGRRGVNISRDAPVNTQVRVTSIFSNKLEVHRMQLSNGSWLLSLFKAGNCAALKQAWTEIGSIWAV